MQIISSIAATGKTYEVLQASFPGEDYEATIAKQVSSDQCLK